MYACLVSAKKIENFRPKAHYYGESVPRPSWIVTMSGWLTHCHVLIMKACASRSCSTAVAPCLTGRHCGAIVIWNILYRSCGGDTSSLIGQMPPFFCLSLLPALREKDCSGETRCLLSSLDHIKVKLSTEQAVSLPWCLAILNFKGRAEQVQTCASKTPATSLTGCDLPGLVGVKSQAKAFGGWWYRLYPTTTWLSLHL